MAKGSQFLMVRLDFIEYIYIIRKKFIVTGLGQITILFYSDFFIASNRKKFD